MAVFPRTIVKSYDGDQNLLETLIAPGGREAIEKGEIVLWRGPSFNRLYTLDRNDQLVIIGKRL